MTRRIIGNLFAESGWARAAAVQRRGAGRYAPSPLDPRFLPRDDVLDHVAPLATLLRAFAEVGDILWTPRPVAPERMPDVPGLARPVLLSGERPTPEPGDLTWAGADAVACVCNDRRLALEIQRENGWLLPGARAIEDIADADDAVRVAAAASPSQAWVAKAVHSAAGRGRVGSRGPLAPPHRTGIDRLLEMHGAVVVEPWMPRFADYGSTAAVTDAGGVGEIDLHVLENTPRGDFRGISFPATTLSDDEARMLRTATAAAGKALAERGFRGPFGVDAFRWRDSKGRPQFHPLCEINARGTFGRVARALAARIGAAIGRPAEGPWILRVGDAAEFTAAQTLHGAGFIPLLLPGGSDGVAAWMVAPAERSRVAEAQQGPTTSTSP